LEVDDVEPVHGVVAVAGDGPGRVALGAYGVVAASSGARSSSSGGTMWSVKRRHLCDVARVWSCGKNLCCFSGVHRGEGRRFDSKKERKG
jgi:hypothetical protein